MGLKTTNYTIKELGITLPNAYALLKDIKVVDNRGVATFNVQSTRETATELKPIETVAVEFVFDRTENPVETAYKAVKGTREDWIYDEEKDCYVKQPVPQPLYGWEDDIITE